MYVSYKHGTACDTHHVVMGINYINMLQLSLSAIAYFFLTCVDYSSLCTKKIFASLEPICIINRLYKSEYFSRN